jgi:AAA15 family ATPase/GTPase
MVSTKTCQFKQELRMSIENIVVSNFKGIREEANFDIKPITVFIGQNSSGKSSCLHAIATLSQTIKLGNSIPL